MNAPNTARSVFLLTLSPSSSQLLFCINRHSAHVNLLKPGRPWDMDQAMCNRVYNIKMTDGALSSTRCRFNTLFVFLTTSSQEYRPCLCLNVHVLGYPTFFFSASSCYIILILSLPTLFNMGYPGYRCNAIFIRENLASPRCGYTLLRLKSLDWAGLARFRQYANLPWPEVSSRGKWQGYKWLLCRYVDIPCSRSSCHN